MTWKVCLQVHDSLLVRNVVRPEPFINLDYKALEMVIMGDLCIRLFGDDQIARATAPGAPDIHCANAISVFGVHLGWTCPDGTPVKDIPVDQFKAHPHGKKLREMIKTVWYGLQYGKTGYGFSVLEGADGKPIGEKVADGVVDAILNSVPGLRSWQKWCRDTVDRYHGIYSLGGRWCPLDDESSPNAPEWLRNRGYRRAYNYPLQASGAEIVGDAMVRVHRCPELADPATGLDRAVELLRGHMCAATANGTPLLVPLQVSVGTGDNYHEAK